MRIGMMLRVIDAIDGPGIYTLNLLDNLFSIDSENEYVLFYKTKKHMGRYSMFGNVKEVLIDVSSTLIWDQVAFPFYAWKEKVDVIYNPKFSVPLATDKATVMMIRGSEWFVFPEFYKSMDILYIKFLMPLFCKKATKLIAISEHVKQDFVRFLGVDSDKISKVYNAPNNIFKQIKDEKTLIDVKDKYNLPDKFVLTVSRGFHHTWQGTYSGKNVENIISGFQKSSIAKTHKLVIAGKEIKEYLVAKGRDDLAESPNVIFCGYVDQEELPAFYNLAECFLFLSFYESFGIPVAESMACGCPIIASKSGALPEVAQDAAVYVEDFTDPDSIAKSIDYLMSNPELQDVLIEKGLKRAGEFNFQKIAEDVLAVILSAVKE